MNVELVEVRVEEAKVEVVVEEASDLEEGELPVDGRVDAGQDDDAAESADEPTGQTGGKERGKRRKLKKQRKLVEAGKGRKEDYYDVYGANARAEATLQPPAASAPTLKLQELHQIATWTLGDGMSPRWVFVKNKPLVEKVVVIFAAGLDSVLYGAKRDLFPHLRACFGEPCTVAGLGSTADTAAVAGTILSVPTSRKRKEREAEEARVGARGGNDGSTSQSGRDSGLGRTIKRLRGNEQSTAAEHTPTKDQGHRPALNGQSPGPLAASPSLFSPRRRAEPSPFPPSYYVLTESELRENQFPMLEQPADGSPPRPPPGYVLTQTRGAALKACDIVAVDCEMCYTAEGLELTRISAVDKEGKVLFDKFVKPTNPITDYNTQYSGITAAMLEGVSTTIHDIQRELLEVVAADTMLVGHSLNSDLTALKVVHLRCIDTALLYSHPKGPPYRPALRVLAERFLNRSIQAGTKGHDSVEDARATMDLTLLKFRNGPSFGEPQALQGESLVALLGKKGRRCTLLDRRRLLHRFAVGTSSAIICASDTEVATKTTRELKKPATDFVWCRLAELSSHYEEAARNPEAVSARAAELTALLTCSGEAGLANSPVSPALEEVLGRLDARLKAMHEAALPNTLMLVATGHGDTALVRRLQEVKWKKMAGAALGAEGWDEPSEKVLLHLSARAKSALAFVTVKQ